MAFLASAVVVVALALGVVWRRRHPKAFPAAFSFLLDTSLRDVVLARTDLSRRLALEPGTRALEIGPGGGFYTEALVNGNREPGLVCLDLQPAMLHKVRRRLGARVPHLVCGSASELPFRDGCFERILLVSVLGEVPDRGGALRECARLLSEDGVLVVAEALVDPDYVPPSTLIREAARGGLAPLDRVGAWPSYTHRFVRSDRRAGAPGTERVATY
ncbi:MAG: class I SAM-dependent methyltransferase [Gemmatimonadaceae bacterium]